MRKHGLTFEDACIVFSDPMALIRDDYTDCEHLQHIVGHVGGTLLVLVVFTERDQNGEESYRIISDEKSNSGREEEL